MDERERTLKAWMDAEEARQAHSEQYFSAGWVDDGPMPMPAKVLDAEALAEFQRLDKAVADAREAYRAVTT